ncbi:magnesium/cobalt transporter CorA [Owenweeksia hongkongensis]|uniref:magnesium/cobalt transporter CorA n=1 Tax=Owenweeksia hongkongensis TaxID=253245 RepID=UPI003A9007FE
MARFYKKRSANKGLPPGSLVFIGTKKVDTPTVEYVSYDQENFTESEFLKVENVPKNDPEKRQWYNITGLDNEEFMAHIQERLNIHPLAMEDVMNTGQRAKFEEFEEFAFTTLKMLQFDSKASRVITEQVSFVIKGTTLITFQEEPGDTFDAVRKRLRNPKSNIRKLGPDYLAYALMDSIVDNYVYLIEGMGEKVDDLEMKILEDPDEDALQQINMYKRELHFILKVVRPVRELTHNLIRTESEFIDKKKTLAFYKDLDDLITHVIESAEAYRQVLTDYLQVYHTNVSAKMNDIMKVLTIFSAIFIPLSFFAGVYGTNFDYFPELHFKYSYFIFWGVIVTMAGGMLYYFKRKGWF